MIFIFQVYACVFSDCNSSFSSPNGLLNHLLEKHRGNRSDKLACHTCDQKFHGNFDFNLMMNFIIFVLMLVFFRSLCTIPVVSGLRSKVSGVLLLGLTKVCQLLIFSYW